MRKVKLLVMAIMMTTLLSGSVQAGLWDPPLLNPSCESVENGGTPGGWGYIIDDWYESETPNAWANFYEGSAGIGLTGDGALWFGTETGGLYYQDIGTWDAGQTYTINLLIGSRASHGGFVTGSMKLYAGGDVANAADATDLSTISGVTELDVVEYTTADGTETGVGTNVYEVALQLSTGTGQTPGDTLWLEFGSVAGKDYFDNIQIKNPNAPILIYPVGEENQPWDLTLEWAPPPTFTPGGYNIYLDPNMDEVAARNPAVKYNTVIDPDPNHDVTGLAHGETYYWLVEARQDPVSTPPTDPNWVPSAMATFTTMPDEPIIDKHPDDQVRGTANGKPNAVFTVEAINATNYQWKKYNEGGEDPNVGTDSPVLTITNVQQYDEGQYYCVVYNSNFSTPSNKAWLEYARLTGHWSFDGNLVDSAGINHGTYLNGDPNYDTGIVGSHAIDMDGDIGYVDIPVAALPKTGIEISVSLWVNNGPIKQMTTFSAFADNNNRIIQAHLPWSTSEVYWDAGDPTGYDRISKGIAYEEMEGKWNHFVFTKNIETGIMNIYRNGALWQTGTGKTRILFGATSFIIGQAYHGGEHHDGLIDDLQLYNYALDAVAIANIYTSIAGPIVTLNPENLTVEAGQAAEFTAGGIDVEEYRWYKVDSGGDILKWTDVSTTDTSTYSIPNVQKSEEGFYYCELWSSTGSVNTQQAGLWTKRLMSHYKFEDNLNDEVGDWPGQYTDTTANYVAGIDGQALRLFREPNHVSIPGTEDFFNFYPQGMTVNVWAKPVSPYGTSGFMTLVEKENGGSGWEIFDTAQYYGRGISGRLQGVGEIDGGDFDDDQWHMATITFDPNESGIGAFILYENGVAVHSLTGSANTGGTQPVIIGAHDQNGDWSYLGLLDNVRIYSYALDRVEVALLYTTVTGETVCLEDPEFDFNDDCITNLKDFAMFAVDWLECYIVPTCIQ